LKTKMSEAAADRLLHYWNARLSKYPHNKKIRAGAMRFLERLDSQFPEVKREADLIIKQRRAGRNNASPKPAMTIDGLNDRERAYAANVPTGTAFPLSSRFSGSGYLGSLSEEDDEPKTRAEVIVSLCDLHHRWIRTLAAMPKHKDLVARLLRAMDSPETGFRSQSVERLAEVERDVLKAIDDIQHNR
jgi:hypothetical protein